MTLSDLARETLGMFQPPSDESVSEWADKYRIIVGKGASEPGPWRTDRAPYQREIMDAYTQRGIHDIVVMSSAQVGKTDMIMNMMGRTIHIDPGPCLFVMPRDDDLLNFAKERLTPTLDATPCLHERLLDDTTTLFKSFPGGFIATTGAISPAGLKSRPIQNLFCDEVDGYPASAGDEGDPVDLATKRTQNFFNARRVYTSTPKLKKTSRIYKLFLTGTREEWEFPCKHCGGYHKIIFDDIRFDKEVILNDGTKKLYKVTRAVWRCPDCLGEMEEYEVKRAPGKWVAYNPKALEDGRRSFHLNAFISPWARWKDLCKKFLDSKDDPEQLQTFYNLELGLPFEYKELTSRPETLYARREHYNAEIPNGVLVLTMGIDTQGDRMEYEVKGWGREEESWGIKYGVIPGAADEPHTWEMVDELINREWHLENGRRMRIAITFIDSGGNYYDDVIDQCYLRRHKNVFAIKGDNKDTGPLVHKSNSKKKGKTLFILNVSVGKQAVLRNAEVDIPGKRYMHYSDAEDAGYDERYFRGLISEQYKLVKKRAAYVYEWVKIHERNEPLDLCNYCRCAFRGFAIDLDNREKLLYGPKEIRQPESQGRAKRPKGLISRGITV